MAKNNSTHCSQQNIRLVIFDFDGTLGDTRQNIVTTMQMTIAEMGLTSRTDNQCASTIGLPLTGCFKSLYPQADNTTILECAETYRRIFKENILTIHPKTFPMVKETLQLLKDKGMLIAIASSRSHESLVELTKKLEIYEYLSCLIGADDVKEAKPQPEPVFKILSELKVKPTQTLVVGDMNVDIMMGKRAGTKTCGVSYGNGTIQELELARADFIIDNITQINIILQP